MEGIPEEGLLRRAAGGKRGKPRYKTKACFSSLENKSNETGIRWRNNALEWKGLTLYPLFDKKDSCKVQKHALSSPIKYCRVVRRKIKGKFDLDTFDGERASIPDAMMTRRNKGAQQPGIMYPAKYKELNTGQMINMQGITYLTPELQEHFIDALSENRNFNLLMRGFDANRDNEELPETSDKVIDMVNEIDRRWLQLRPKAIKEQMQYPEKNRYYYCCSTYNYATHRRCARFLFMI